MLTIRGYNKLNYRDINLTYYIREVKESQNFYDFYCVNRDSNFSAVIGLKRGMNRIYKGENLHDMIWNGQPTQVSVTSNWISDMNNMIKALISVIEERPW